MTKRLLLVFACALVVSVLALGNSDLEASSGLFQSPPPQPLVNDEFDQAIVIQALPFTDYRDTTDATSSPDDPWECGNNGSVWYAFTPETDMVLEANTVGSNYDTMLSAYSPEIGMLIMVPGACDYNGSESRVAFQASAGKTYYFLVALCCGTGGDGGGSLVFTVEELPPPPNDDFDNAIAVAGVPFTHSSTTLGATLEPGETPPDCASYGPTGSIWYAFSPSESASVMVDLQATYFYTYIGVYTGTSLDNLNEVGSRCDWENRLAFQASEGTTYYIQVGGWYWQTGPVSFQLVTAPPPEVDFYYYPWPPSIYDTVQFQEYCWDPAGTGIETFEWDLGDGTTATGCCPTSNYATDAEYLVELTATTYDGRTGSASQLVQIETHDVAITEFRTPTRAKAGKTYQIVVGLNNREPYDENVYLELYKSVPGYGYWEWIGSSYGSVPAHRANRTFDFEFSYTFTDEDAMAGKVSFRTVANLDNARDAMPADNEAISLPTLIKPLR